MRALALPSLVLAACTALIACGPPCDRKGTGVTQLEGVFKTSDAPFAVKDQVASIPFTFPTQVGCADHVSFELVTSGGDRIPLTDATVEMTSNFEAIAHFTPASAGAYTLQATFEPGSRVALRPLIVGDDRTAATASVVELPVRCDGLAKTASGAWVCNEHVYRSGAEVGTLTGTASREAFGDFVWEDSKGDIRRYHDTGTGAPELDTQIAGSVGCCSDADILLPGEDDALIVDSKLHRQVRNVVGGLTSAGDADFGKAVGGVKSFLGEPVLVRDGATAFLVYQQQATSEACVFTVDPSVTAVKWEDASGPHDGCQPLPGTHVGAFDGGVWILVSGTPSQLVFLKPSGKQLVESARMDVPGGLSVEPRFGANSGPPKLYREGAPELLFPRVLNAAISVDLVSPPGGFVYRNARPGYAWITTASSTKVVGLSE